MHAVGRDDPRRVEPPAALPFGVEPDQLAGAGQEGEDARDLEELLEVEHRVVVPRAQRPDEPHDGADEAWKAVDVDRQHAVDETALLEQGPVAGQGEEVDLECGEPRTECLERRAQHEDVPEPVELDAEEPTRGLAGGPAQRWGRRRAQWRQPTATCLCQAVQGEVPRDAHPAVDVACGVEVHARPEARYTPLFRQSKVFGLTCEFVWVPMVTMLEDGER